MKNIITHLTESPHQNGHFCHPAFFPGRRHQDKVNPLSLSTLKGHPASAAGPVSQPHAERPVSSPRPLSARPSRPSPRARGHPAHGREPPASGAVSPSQPRAGAFSACRFSGPWTLLGDPGQLTLPVSFQQRLPCPWLPRTGPQDCVPHCVPRARSGAEVPDNTVRRASEL